MDASICRLFWDVKVLDQFTCGKQKDNTFVCKYWDYTYILFISLRKNDIWENQRRINNLLWFMRVDSKSEYEKEDGIYSFHWYISWYRLSKWYKYKTIKENDIITEIMFYK